MMRMPEIFDGRMKCELACLVALGILCGVNEYKNADTQHTYRNAWIHAYKHQHPWKSIHTKIITACKHTQVGAPSDRAQYIHRIGRTARAGKDGSGLLLLCDFEDFFLENVKDLPLQQVKALSVMEKAAIMPKVEKGLKEVEDDMICHAYQVRGEFV